MDLSRFVRRLLVRPPAGEKVELKPVEQACLARIIATSGATAAGLQPEVDARSPVLRQDAAEVVAGLISKGLVEARLRPDGDALFVASAKGMKLRGRLPPEPSTVTDFWL
jgi:hypothetical protein